MRPRRDRTYTVNVNMRSGVSGADVIAALKRYERTARTQVGERRPELFAGVNAQLARACKEMGHRWVLIHGQLFDRRVCRSCNARRLVAHR